MTKNNRGTSVLLKLLGVGDRKFLKGFFFEFFLFM